MENDSREKESTHGAREVDPRVGATIVVEITMPESDHRVKREEKQKARAIIRHKGNGQDGTPGSDQCNGRICAQVIPKDGERASQKVLMEWNMAKEPFLPLEA